MCEQPQIQTPLSPVVRTHFLGPNRSHAFGHRAMVATSHPLATLAAHRLLANGGNALDAALTAVIVQGVVDPAMTGVGGDCFCLLARDGAAPQAYNGSGRSPQDARLDDLAGRRIAAHDPAALTIPGAVEAWGALHRRFGKAPWADLFAEAIDYARNGFLVQERVAYDWRQAADFLAHDPQAAKTYLHPDQSPPCAGTLWRLPELAQTLETLAHQGAEAFYQGPLAEALVQHCQARGGKHRLQDFHDHKGAWVTPLHVSYAGRQIFAPPPNGQGLVALIAFAVLERAKVEGWLRATSVFDPDRVDWQMRALSAGYEVRDRLLADPAFCPEVTTAALSPDYIARIAHEVAADKKAQTPLYRAAYTPPHRDTVYVAARDCSGLSVSLINSIFNAFGAGQVAGETGILLHSRGLSFSVDPAHPNAYGPGKRPMHTIVPALALREGRVETVFGVMGAHYQPQGQVHVFTAMVDCGLSPQAAQDLPRWFANPEGHVDVEATVPADLVSELRRRLGDVRVSEEPLGGSQVIQVLADGVMVGGTDPRKDGLALGL